MATDPYTMLVKEVMSRDIVSVTAQDTVHECIKRMTANRVSSLPVLGAHDECVGIISTSDLMEVTQELDEDLEDLAGADLLTGRWLLERLMGAGEQRTVAEFMSEDVATVTVDTHLAKAAREMLRNGVHRLPVLDVKERVVGIVSTTDILAAFVDGDPQD